MDGTMALKFVRSRHGTNNEGSDFARSRRQQQVLAAFKDKALTLDTLSDPQKVIGLLGTFGESVDIDLPISEYPTFIKFAREIKVIRSFVIDPSVKPPVLVAPPAHLYGGAFVLIPPNNNFGVIHSYVDKIISGSPEATPSSERKLE
jgi:polyisoprenyl-teichoic acid--peptidoglycan teichoic acid transferase